MVQSVNKGDCEMRRYELTDTEWESDEIVIINGKRLYVRKDSYDWRRK